MYHLQRWYFHITTKIIPCQLPRIWGPWVKYNGLQGMLVYLTDIQHRLKCVTWTNELHMTLFSCLHQDAPCCSKDETKSSKRQLWAPTPEPKRKRISKRPLKKRFIIDYDDYQSSDVSSISDICFACQHASLPSGVFRESIQWISCKKCSLWYHKYCCNMEIDNADFTCKDCSSFAIGLEV